MKPFFWVICLFFSFPIFLSSCYVSKNIPYFQDIKDTSKIYSQVIKSSYEAHIQPDDMLEIIVNSINPQATAIFNLGNNVSTAPGLTSITGSSTPANVRNSPSPGYLVNKQGIIDFPVLGKLQVKGLSLGELKDSLIQKLDVYLKDPIINVRIMNYKITVLGEVAHPSSYNLQSERLSVVDAIGLAGDLTIYGKRENVLLIREENGQRNFVRLNLNSSSIFESPYYYLKQNDIVYVEPSKTKIAATDTQTVRNFSLITSLITLLVVVIARI